MTANFNDVGRLEDINQVRERAELLGFKIESIHVRDIGKENRPLSVGR
jgi:hypothetical protein